MYRRRLLFSTFENIDAGRKSMYNVEILTAMRWMAEKWSACPKHVIRICSMHCFKQRDTTETENGIQDDEKETIDSMARDCYRSWCVVHEGRATESAEPLWWKWCYRGPLIGNTGPGSRSCFWNFQSSPRVERSRGRRGGRGKLRVVA